jgi:RsiW-degrading membrane proteinase PrsW (M82 family)
MTETWDQPDLVWFAGYLNTSQVLLGIFISLVAGILPSLAYILIVYNLDKNEKEPKSLVTAALIWGAFPAILVAIIASLLLKIPPDLVGPQAIEAIQIGFISPFFEELLKGAIVIFIAKRYNKEFNNTLDGIIYGAIVGLGFAMTGNTFSYLGSFLYRGFDSLKLTILVEGLLFGLNHAFYTSIFGLGLGYAKQLSQQHKRLMVPIAAFLLAVAVNGSHEYAIQSLTGITPLTLILNWIGISMIFVIMFLSIRHEKRILREQLRDELPESIYLTFTAKGKRKVFLKSIRNRYGKKMHNEVNRKFNSITKLAFLKYQYSNHPEKEILAEIEKIRKELKAIDSLLDLLPNNEISIH